MKAVVVAAGAVVLPVSVVVGLAAISSTSAPAAAAATQLCVTRGAVHELDSAAATNARVVVAVAEAQGGSSAAVIAVMTAYTESGLKVLGNPLVPTSGAIQGIGTDHDSIGLFQQRASWGSIAQRLDPQLSTGLFVKRLLALPGWRSEQPWVAAQNVQSSAWDGHPRAANHYSSVYGGNYRANYALAQRIVAEIDRDAAQQSCGTLSGGLAASDAPGSHGLPTNYVVPASATPAESKVVTYAIAQLDKPYVFGAAGPGAFDCSGLTLAAWAQAGVTLPHDANAQSHLGVPTTPDALVPGDLVFVPGDDGTLAAPGHVGIYIGSGLVLNAADQQIGIRVQTYDNFVDVGHGLAALRHYK